ncbi:hypothetical protein [Neisseria meningitidis]|nr:hypothetical protein [Neisseria meningitidis]
MPSERQAHRAIRFHCKRMKSSKYSGLTKTSTALPRLSSKRTIL